MFKNLYTNVETHPRENILFLLTSGGKMDYMGLRHWLKTTNTKILDSIEIFISLDTLTGLNTQNQLYMHYSKPPKDEISKSWYDRFKEASKAENVSLIEIQKKINLASSYMTWEHEHAAQFKILSITMSGVKDRGNPLFSSSILDQDIFINYNHLNKVMRIIGNAISSRIYNNERLSLNIFKENDIFDVNDHFIMNWMRHICQYPKMMPYYVTMTELIRTFLESHTDKMIDSKYYLDKNYRFYNGDKFELMIYKTKGLLFDLVMLILIIIYLSMLFVILGISTRGWKEFLKIFQPMKYKPYKHSYSKTKSTTSAKGFINQMIEKMKFM